MTQRLYTKLSSINKFLHNHSAGSGTLCCHTIRSLYTLRDLYFCNTLTSSTIYRFYNNRIINTHVIEFLFALNQVILGSGNPILFKSLPLGEFSFC